MKNYKDKLAIYTEPEFGYKWLMKVDSQEKKKCENDWFKHLYLSGQLIKINENMKIQICTLNHNKTNISNVRLKNLNFIEEPSLKELFN